jgi:hypothetical protein
MTLADPDRDQAPRRVEGELVTRYVPTLDYTQYWVDGEPVDPTTIQMIDEDEQSPDKADE